MENGGWLAWLDSVFQSYIVSPIASVLFYDLVFWDNGADGEIQLPLVVAWLVMGAFFFTLRFQFINLRGFLHSIRCVRGVYAKAGDPGEITHFQALSAALSATVGLGNIAGVAVAVGVGGPGAVFWMIVAGALGMNSKFAECTLGMKYRVTRPDGHVSGGPMHYLRTGLEEIGWGRLGRVLAPVAAIMCIGGSFGGGNMFQSNQSYAQLASVVPALDGPLGAVSFGLALVVLVGVVIIGGIRRIGRVASTLVPFMCGVYVTCGLLILLYHATEIPAAFGKIVQLAFSFEAGLGGFVGVLVQGFRRAAFSNEAGVGSAAIAHSAATTNEPIREGMVALLEPFIDTIIVCTMTGLVIVVTGAYEHPDAGSGIQMTSWAFATLFPWFPVVLTVTALLFAFSTMISWSYYGEQCWVELFGLRSIMLYKLLFLLCVWAGAVFEAKAVLDFGDLMILGMALPNITGVVLLSGVVKRDLETYLGKLAAGEFEAD
ncbi:MAG: alanine:cation symporter family protein [bacterium]|nr:alanine:cation symporter family protein [bacterium]